MSVWEFVLICGNMCMNLLELLGIEGSLRKCKGNLGVNLEDFSRVRGNLWEF